MASKEGAAFSDPREGAREYLQSHQVLELFQELGTALMYTKPEDPRAFLVETLQGLKQKQESERLGSSIFTDVDVRTLFGMFDPTGKGTIDAVQCRQALSDLCLNAPESVPEKVSLEEFVTMYKAAKSK